MKKAINILKAIIRIFLMCAMGFVLGMVIQDDYSVLTYQLQSNSAATLVFLVMMYVTRYLQVILHEAGHLLFGLLSGYKFVSFRVLRFMWIRNEDGIHLKRYHLPGTAGQCGMEPPDMQNGRFPVALYYLGGSIMDLIVFAVSAALWYVLAWKLWVYGAPVMFLAIQSMWSLYSALCNGIPMKGKLTSNDGRLLLELRRNPDAMRARWIGLKFSAESARGRSPLEMPDEWFEMPGDAQMKSFDASIIALMNLQRKMDAMQLEEAAAMVDHLLSADISISGNNRYELVCEKMFFELIGKNDPATLEGLRTKEQMKAMKRMTTNLGVIRTEYAYALLSRGDRQLAGEVRERFDKVAEKYPRPQVVRNERKLMELVDQIAAERQNPKE